MFHASLYGSCLELEPPDLDRILDVFLIAAKYDAREIKHRAGNLARALSQHSPIKPNLGLPLSAFRQVEVGSILGMEELASAGWGPTIEGLKARTIPLAGVLNLAERSKNPRYMSEAYYEGMLQGYRSWNADKGLSPRQKLNLLNGTVKCSQAMDDAVDNFGSLPPHVNCNIDTLEMCSYHCVEQSSISSALSRHLTSDILSRLRIIIESEAPIHASRWCHHEARQMAANRLALAESNIILYFLEDDPELLQPEWLQRPPIIPNILPIPASSPMSLPKKSMKSMKSKKGMKGKKGKKGFVDEVRLSSLDWEYGVNIFPRSLDLCSTEDRRVPNPGSSTKYTLCRKRVSIFNIRGSRLQRRR